MLEKPILSEKQIVACIAKEYGLRADTVTFLPLGADSNTAVYRADATNGTAYLVKLRRGEWDAASVTVPTFLHRQGIRQAIPPLPASDGQLWATLDAWRLILYPFIQGKDGYARPLTAAQWVEFGAALKRLHTISLPSPIIETIRREDFSPHWRKLVERFVARIDRDVFTDPTAIELSQFLRIKRNETLALVAEAEKLGQILRAQPPEFVLCHGDIHGWNLLVADTGALYIVDWDTLVFAPKERDLMFVGAGLGNSGYTMEQEESMFFQGYGETPVNESARAYYRFERIVQDIAAFCEQIFLSEGGEQDRKQAVESLKSNFLPDGTLARAWLSAAASNTQSNVRAIA